MAAITPSRLVLRCYGHKTRSGRWVGVCLNLNIAIEADTPEELKLKMNDAIVSYVNAAKDTQDRPSVPELLTRSAPVQDWVIYFLIRIFKYVQQIPVSFVRRIQDNFIFKEMLPFHLANEC